MRQPRLSGLQKMSKACRGISSLIDPLLAVRKPQKMELFCAREMVLCECWVLSSPWLQLWQPLMARCSQDAVQFTCHISRSTLAPPAWGEIRYWPPSHRANLQPCFAEQLCAEAVLGDGWRQMVARQCHVTSSLRHLARLPDSRVPPRRSSAFWQSQLSPSEHSAPRHCAEPASNALSLLPCRREACWSMGLLPRTRGVCHHTAKQGAMAPTSLGDCCITVCSLW